MKTIVPVTGLIKFCSLAAAKAHPEYPNDPARYRIEFNTPQSNVGELEQLKKVIGYVGQTVWGGGRETAKRMRAVQRTIEEGDGTNSGCIGLLNGDEHKPEYNTGQFVVRASAKSAERPIYRKWDPETETYAITEDVPEQGDLVRVLIEVWAMKQHSRINFTIKAVQVMEGGKGFMPITGGQKVSPDMIDEGMESENDEEVLGLFDAFKGGAPALTEEASHGYDDAEEEEEEAPAPKKAAKKKRAAKKKAAAKPVEAELVEDEPDEEEETSGGLFAGL